MMADCLIFTNTLILGMHTIVKVIKYVNRCGITICIIQEAEEE